MEDISDDEETYGADISDEDEACTLSMSKIMVPKLTSRIKHKSEANWISQGSFAGMAEVVKFKGNLLKNTGIVRESRVLLHVEEIGYLMQREALMVLNKGSIVTIMDVYTHIMTGYYGCTWEAFKVYLELKSLGYIVGRHKVPWSSSRDNRKRPGNMLGVSSDELPIHFQGLQVQDERRIQDEINTTSSKGSMPSGVHRYGDCVVELMFDVFPPSSSFKKTDPGTPDFSLCISSNSPPDHTNMEALKDQNEGIPVTIATVESGRVSFFRFNEVELPCLP